MTTQDRDHSGQRKQWQPAGTGLEEEAQVQEGEEQPHTPQGGVRDVAGGQEEQHGQGAQEERRPAALGEQPLSEPPGKDGYAQVEETEQRVEREALGQPLRGEVLGGPDRFRRHREESRDEVERPVLLEDGHGARGRCQREEGAEQQRRVGRLGLQGCQRREGEEEQRSGQRATRREGVEGPPQPPRRQRRQEVEENEERHEQQHRWPGLLRRVGPAQPAGEDQHGREARGRMQEAGTADRRQHRQADVDEEEEAEEQPRRGLERWDPGEADREEQRKEGGDERGLVEEVGQAEGLRCGGVLGRLAGAAEEIRHRGEQREDEEDHRGDGQILGSCGRELEKPAPLVERREDEAGGRQQGPALPVSHPGEAHVQQQQVGEQADGLVLAGREQDGRRKAAHQPQQRHEDRIVAQGQQHRQRPRSDAMNAKVGSAGMRCQSALAAKIVENRSADAGGVEGVGGHRIAPSPQLAARRAAQTPTARPMAIRTGGPSQPASIEALRKLIPAMTMATPATHEKRRTPTRLSQSKGFFGGGGSFGGGGVTSTVDAVGAGGSGGAVAPTSQA